MYNDLKELQGSLFHYLLWMMFRESAKTSIIKMYVTWCICYQKRHYINWDSFDKDNAESALFDVATWLQTNQRIIADFGQLYYDENKDFKKSRMQRLGSFVTQNNIKVEAFSTGEPVRGRVYQEFRPDLVILDDFETNKTKKSMATTASVIEHIDELLSGVGNDAQVIFLCNYITESGSVQYILDKAENNKDVKVRRVDVEMGGKWNEKGQYEGGQIVWEDKYVRTDEEAALINRTIQDTKKHKVSLESKKNTLGEDVYATEMMNSPEAAGDLIYDRAKVDLAIQNATDPLKTAGDIKIWKEYIPGHRYAVGGDTSKGVERDACAAVVIDFTTNEVVATYANNKIPPDDFAYILQTLGEMYGICLVAPEVNNTGYATVTELKRIYPIAKIYTQVVKDTNNPNDKGTRRLGWETTGSNKTEIVYQFKKTFEAGDITIYDVGMLNEMKRFGQMDLRATDSERAKTTRHFDKLTAGWIAWEMRHYALVGDEPTHSQYKPNFKKR